MKTYKDFEPFSKDQAYWERNQLVAALSKVFPSWMELHPLEDKEWDKDWRHIIYIEVPNRGGNVQGHQLYLDKQLSWHIHDDDVPFFKHLELKKGNSWDGHTTEEKYQRLSELEGKK
jgi:hypothetical protein